MTRRSRSSHLMHAPFLIVVALIGGILAGEDAGIAQEVLTNDGVIKMVRVGLSEAVVLAKIRSSQAKFDVGTDALVALKRAGVSDRIIEAMVTHGSVAATPSTPSSPPSPGPPLVIPFPQMPGVTRGREVMYHLLGDKQVTLTPAVGEIQRSREFMSYKEELVLPRRTASYRVVERQPVFLSSVPPTEAPLARLKRGSSHDDRNLKIASGTRAPYGGGTDRRGVRAEDQVELEVEEATNGYFRIRPRRPLEPGEYAFVLTFGVAGRAGGKVFDFGVD